MNKKFKSEFERRLFRLADAIELYKKTGNPTSVLPFLFQAFTFKYSNEVFIKSKK